MGQYSSTPSTSSTLQRHVIAVPMQTMQSPLSGSSTANAANNSVSKQPATALNSIIDHSQRLQDPDVATFTLHEKELEKPLDDVFQVVSKLGEGSYGSVHKAIHKTSKQVLALKKIPLDTDLKEIVKEVTIMQQCDSSYVVKYFGSYFEDTNLWIVMEYCSAGSVSDIMKRRRKTLNEQELSAIIRDTLMGLGYLHELKKIHRDVKAGNILLTAMGHAKLADFGVAGQLTDTIVKRNTVIGTPFWISPEVIQEIGYDTKADIWSLGITAIEMAEGRPPHADMHPMRAIFIIPTESPPALKHPDEWSHEFNDFIAHCLVKRPEERTPADVLLNHVFIKSAAGPEVVRLMIQDAQNALAQYPNVADNTYMSDDENDSGTLIRHDDDVNFTLDSDMNDGTMVQHTLQQPPKFNTAMERLSLSENDDNTVKNLKQNMFQQYKSASPGGLPPPPAYAKQQVQQGKALLDKNSQAFGAYKSYGTDNGPIGAGNSTSSSLTSGPDDPWAYGTFGTPVPIHGNYLSDLSNLASMSTEQLLRAKKQLDEEMDAELRALKARYQAKRQAISDAITAKQTARPQ